MDVFEIVNLLFSTINYNAIYRKKSSGKRKEIQGVKEMSHKNEKRMKNELQLTIIGVILLRADFKNYDTS